ncbi:enoyl-CoA hydratase/carnithine racemase [Legionella lansingensis]|uniref:3-hydroxyisobutyryl-CoA hydrolase n=1 Tax=Legionella lansingensis TaxID=45067 RepID=A0A0W0VZQ8_9GAMM|nr:enoyl-CoA hydratase/isomerase family protein [Legionella lansingensis]KTD25465.1 Enoyl-CoA hydratase/carnithine racemase [Legionella lansingensis]SNV51497.1 enoyl-CoA hydratase/carnithine racemase [Legionella lansingensis]
MHEHIVFAREGSIGLIILNRPQALNALTLEMIQALQQQLSVWEKDADVHAVLVQAEGEKAFCAGGDVRWLYQTGLSQDPQQMQFFWHEYRLNHYIHCFSKPYISLMDGMTMGGGVGISLHGSHPIATERFIFAMPETGIGFFPDIGASYLLSRCPGFTGIYLGLTGNRLQAQDAYALGLVKSVVLSSQIPELINDLLKTDLSSHAHERVSACLKKFAKPLESATIKHQQEAIDECFAYNTVEEIFAALKAKGDEWATTTLNNLSLKAPLSLKVTLAQIQKAKSLSMAECVMMDYGLVGHFMHGHDFYEGIRALLVDKDKFPRWQPDRLEDVTDAMVAHYFESREELSLIAS